MIRPVVYKNCLLTSLLTWMFICITGTSYAVTLSGIVRDSSDLAITGQADLIEVSVYSGGDPCMGMYGYMYKASIDTNGAYSITVPDNDTYVMQATTLGLNYVNEWYSSTGSTSDCGNAEPLAIDVNDRPNLDFQLDVGAEVQGTINDSSGSPITGESSNIQVTLYEGDPCAGNYSWVTNGNITDDGLYSISGLSSGTYYAQTSGWATNYLNEWYGLPASSIERCEATAIVVAAGDVVTGVDFQLDVGAEIKGTISDSSNTPITGESSNIGVSIYENDPCTIDFWGMANVDEFIADDGTYSISGLSTGTYYVLAQSWGTNYLDEWYALGASSPDRCEATAIVVSVGDIVTGVDFQLDTGAEIQGTISDSSGSPITGESSNIQVTLYEGDPCMGNLSVVANGYSTGGGSYSISGLSTGTYYAQAQGGVWIYLNEWYGLPASSPDGCEATAIIVSAGEVVTGVDFQLDVRSEIKGTINDSSNTPITGESYNIGVNLYEGDPCAYGSSWVASGNITDDGSYSIPGLSPGTYYAQTQSWGLNYLNEWYALPASSTDRCEATAIVVSAEEVVTGIDFQLDVGAEIQGTIHDSSGSPITGESYNIGVTLYEGDPCAGNYSWVASGSITNDGSYSISGLSSGTYYAQTQSWGPNYLDEWYALPASSTDRCEATAIVVSVEEVVMGVDFQLDVGATISGTVSDNSGTLIDGSVNSINIDVYRRTPCGTEYVTGQSANSSNYEISGLSSGTYIVYASSVGSNYLSEYYATPASVLDESNAEEIYLASGDTKTGVDFQLNIGGIVSGTLTDIAGDPVGDLFWIGVQLGKGDPCSGSYQVVKSLGLDEPGGFTISGLPTGTYYAQTSSYSWESPLLNGWHTGSVSASSSDCNDAVSFTVTEEQVTTDINFILDLKAEISGLATDSNGDPIADPNSELFVEVYGGDVCGGHFWLAGHGSTDANGNWTILGVDPGTYLIKTSAGGLNYQDEWYTGAASSSDCNEALAVTVAANDKVSDINFQLDAGAQISGTVKGSNGETITNTEFNAQVDVFSGDPCSGNARWVKEGQTTGDGDYTISGLTPGIYYLQAGSWGTSHVGEWYGESASSSDCAMATPVTVTIETSTTGIDFQLDSGGRIGGTVRGLLTDPDACNIYGNSFSVDVFKGSPCGNREFITSQWFWASENQDTVDYQISNIPAGTYYVQVTSWSFIDEWYNDAGSDFQCENAGLVTVEAGMDTGNVDFQVDNGGRISGNILDETDSPVASEDNPFAVLIWDVAPCDAPNGPISTALAFQGSYLSKQLPAGEYYVSVETHGTSYVSEYWAAGGSELDCALAETVFVSVAADTTDVDFHISQGATISGTVYQDNGITPITGENLGVDIWDVSPCDGPTGPVSWAQVDPGTGDFSSEGLPPGEYYLSVVTGGTVYFSEYWANGGSVRQCDQAEPILLALGEQGTGNDFALGMGGSIAGTIYETDGSSELVGDLICVDVFRGTPCDGSTWEYVESACNNVGGMQGNYQSGGLEPGEYFLWANTNDSGYIREFGGGTTSDANCENAVTVTVTTGTTVVGQDFQLAQGGSISGTVFDSDGERISGETSGVTVQIFTGADGCSAGFLAEISNIGLDGSYYGTGFPLGSYYLMTYDHAGLYQDEWYAAGGSSPDCGNAEAITITGINEVSSLDFQLNGDACPNDAEKTVPGQCGCGTADTDTDGDGVADCNDECSIDPLKIEIGICGCGTADTDIDGDGIADCNDECSSDPQKVVEGQCGCNNADTDTDGDGIADCIDTCVTDPNKTEQGQCGCGNADTDTDGDGIADCIDTCSADPNKTEEGQCGCGTADTDSDHDGVADCNDACDDDPFKLEEGVCGCGLGDLDLDGDSIPDCEDNCPGMANTDQSLIPCAGDDNDGIAPNIDGEWRNGAFINEDGKWSNNFSDSEVDGTTVVTYGTIENRNSLTFTIADATEVGDGVFVNVTGNASLTGEAELTVCTYSLLVSRGDSFVASCRFELVPKASTKDGVVKNTGDDTFVIKARYGVVKVKIGEEEFVEIPLDGEVTISETNKGVFEIENTSNTPVKIITTDGEEVLEPAGTATVETYTFPWSMFLPAITANAVK